MRPASYRMLLIGLAAAWLSACAPRVTVTPAGKPDEVAAHVRLEADRPFVATRVDGGVTAVLGGGWTREGWWAAPAYRVSGHGPYVPVVVTGSPLDEPVWVLALVDTGANFEARISEALAERLPLAVADAPPVVLVRAFTRRSLTRARVESLRLGPVDVGPLQPPVGTAGPEAIAIGMATLSRYRAVVFDWGANRVLLDAPYDNDGPDLDAWRADPRWHAVKAVAEPPVGGGLTGRWLVRATLEGDELVALADTGYVGGLLLPVDLDEAPQLRVRLGVAFLSDRIQRSPRRLRLRRGDLKLDGLLFDEAPVSVAAEEWFTPETARPVLGMEVLGERPIWFDFEEGVLRVWRSNDPLPVGEVRGWRAAGGRRGITVGESGEGDAEGTGELRPPDRARRAPGAGGAAGSGG